MIGRREFTTLLGGAAAARPVAARAQQSAMPVVGLLSPLAPGSSEHLLHAFRRGLAESGRIEGQTVAIDYRLASGFDRLPELAANATNRHVRSNDRLGGQSGLDMFTANPRTVFGSGGLGTDRTI